MCFFTPKLIDAASIGKICKLRVAKMMGTGQSTLPRGCTIFLVWNVIQMCTVVLKYFDPLSSHETLFTPFACGPVAIALTNK